MKVICPECGKSLTEGLEYQFPPRKEIDTGKVVAYAPVVGDGKLCKRDDRIRGFVWDIQTGKTTYPDDLPALEGNSEK